MSNKIVKINWITWKCPHGNNCRMCIDCMKGTEEYIRNDERQKIISFIGQLKIDDVFHHFWKNEVQSTSEDILNNTLDMVITELSLLKKELESIGNKVPSIPSKDGNGGEVTSPQNDAPANVEAITSKGGIGTPKPDSMDIPELQPPGKEKPLRCDFWQDGQCTNRYTMGIKCDAVAGTKIPLRCPWNRYHIPEPKPENENTKR